MVGELLRETFELDSRLVRTLKLLLFKPGMLALEFSRNRRASYVSPIRLYLFVSILFFFLLSMSTEVGTETEQATVQIQLKDVKDTDTSLLLALLDDARADRAHEILARPGNSIARLILLEVASDLKPEDLTKPDPTFVFLLREGVDALYEPGSVARQFMDNLAAGMFVMLPVYALLLKLFYPFRKRFYVENLVFSTHLHSFIYLVLMLQMLLSKKWGIGWLNTGLGALTNGLTLWILVYHYLALKRYFNEGSFRTLLKFSGLLTLYLLLLMPTAFLLVLAVTLLQV